MAGKTLIGGVAYDVAPGKVLIGGVARDINAGKTLIGGVAYDIKFGAAYDPVFANNTWEQIIAACQNNAVPDTWAVADQKAMTINGTSYMIDIIGKNHDTYTGGGTAPLTFQLHDLYGTKYQMNSSGVNSGGWKNTNMRNTHLPSIIDAMPTVVKTSIREVVKFTSAGNRSTTIETTEDKLFLLSEVEVFGRCTYSKAGEGSRYAYYANGNTVTKKFAGTASGWLERSPHGSDVYAFCSVYSMGFADNVYANSIYGVSFAFCF